MHVRDKPPLRAPRMRRYHFSRFNFHAMDRSGSGTMRSLTETPIIISAVCVGLRICGVSQDAMRVLLEFR
jgi:hypothetical protein